MMRLIKVDETIENLLELIEDKLAEEVLANIYPDECKEELEKINIHLN